MILDQSFFGFQDALFIKNKIFSLAQMTVDRRRPPPLFFAAAWGSMLRNFADEIRTVQRMMASVVRDTNGWTPCWTAWKPASESKKLGLSSGCTMTPEAFICTVHADPPRNTTTTTVCEHQNVHQNKEKAPEAVVVVRPHHRLNWGAHEMARCALVGRDARPGVLTLFLSIPSGAAMHRPGWVHSVSVYPQPPVLTSDIFVVLSNEGWLRPTRWCNHSWLHNLDLHVKNIQKCMHPRADIVDFIRPLYGKVWLCSCTLPRCHGENLYMRASS